MRLFQKIKEKIRNLFSRYYYFSAEKTKEFSEKILSQGIFQFFRPVYRTNGVDLYLEDLEGLRRYRRELEEENLENSRGKNYFFYQTKQVKDKADRFLEGVQRGLDWILENTIPFKDFNSIEFCYSPAYNSFKINRTREGYRFIYG